MAMSTEDKTDLTPLQRHSHAWVERPGSPLKQEVVASPDLDSAPPSPTLSRGTLTYDQTHRWTVLAREAEADEVSILSVNSEDRGYYTSLFDGTMPEEPAQQVTVLEPVIVEGSRASSRLGSLSGFSEGILVEQDVEEEDPYYRKRNTREESVERFSEIDFEDTVQLPLDPLPYKPPSSPLTRSEEKKLVYYPLPIPKQIMLPPRLTGPTAEKDLLPAPAFRPPKQHATTVLDSFLDTHTTALQDDPEVVLQTEFDDNTLLGTLMNNLRGQKQDIKGRARTNENYVPGGKSLLEMDREAVQRMQMGKALSSRGGRNWGSSGHGSSATPSPYHDDEVFESVSLADIEWREEDEDVPLAMVRQRIVTQRHDAEESLVERMKRLKREKQKREMEEGETLLQRKARLKAEEKETLSERIARLKMEKS